MSMLSPYTGAGGYSGGAVAVSPYATPSLSTSMRGLSTGYPMVTMSERSMTMAAPMAMMAQPVAQPMVQAVPQTPMAVQTVPPPITPAATSYVPRPHQLPIMPQKAWYDKTSKKLEKDTLDDEKELAKMRMLQIKLEKARCDATMASIVAQEKALLAAQAELDIRDHQYHFKDKMEKRLDDMTGVSKDK